MYSPVLSPHRAFFLSTLGKFYVIIDIHQEKGKNMKQTISEYIEQDANFFYFSAL